MPVMDGLEATREIRRLESESGGMRHLPVIALTARAMAEDRAACCEAGMDDFVTKPIDRAELTRALERAAAVVNVVQTV